jgi:hypothetical protein
MAVIFAMGLGLFAPPFGVGFYAACAIGGVSPDVAMPRVWPHMAALFLAMLLLTLVPWFSDSSDREAWRATLCAAAEVRCGRAQPERQHS